MSYISITHPGIARGPHEHVYQTDIFGFIGPSEFRLYLWDNRNKSVSFMTRQTVIAGEKNPVRVIIPPGVVHAYKNIGNESGMVVNYPNQLFAGHGKKEKVDEIRHESDPASIFILD
jgi:dTDP-4-dehydrorhamnose 3,5-epimerase